VGCYPGVTPESIGRGDPSPRFARSGCPTEKVSGRLDSNQRPPALVDRPSGNFLRNPPRQRTSVIVGIPQIPRGKPRGRVIRVALRVARYTISIAVSETLNRLGRGDILETVSNPTRPMGQ
jgi:hypothetical protein